MIIYSIHTKTEDGANWLFDTRSAEIARNWFELGYEVTAVSSN